MRSGVVWSSLEAGCRGGVEKWRGGRHAHAHLGVSERAAMWLQMWLQMRLQMWLQMWFRTWSVSERAAMPTESAARESSSSSSHSRLATGLSPRHPASSSSSSSSSAPTGMVTAPPPTERATEPADSRRMPCEGGYTLVTRYAAGAVTRLTRMYSE